MNRHWLKLLSLCGVLAVAGVAHLGQASAEVFPLDAIGKLLADDNNVCTAFVVRSVERPLSGRYMMPRTVFENWLVSAGHCYGQRLTFWQPGAAYPVLRILGYSSGGDEGFDVMVATFITSRPRPTLEPAFEVYPQVGEPLLLIGYGRNVLMMRVGPLVGYDTRGHMEIQSYASPGNSGGPVLIPGTRRVVGIGIETTLDRPAGTSSLYCMLGACPVKPPYTATHIDRLRGVASFR